MNTLKYLFVSMLTLVCGISLSACSDDDNERPNNFKVTPTELAFGGEGGTQQFSVLSDGEPTVTVTPINSGDDVSWVSVVQVSGLTDEAAPAANTRYYAVTVTPDSAESSRSAYVKVVYGTSMKEITVTQTPKDLYYGTAGMEHNAKELAKMMYAGINIGNTMECTPEGSWNSDGAAVNEDYIRGLKAAGFNAVRIPVAWAKHISTANKQDGTFTINADWMQRVKRVVSWCVANDMYVVLNCHWDDGWLEDHVFDDFYVDTITVEQKAIWTQIAKEFNAFDEHLLFAACNEPGMNETSAGKSWEDVYAIEHLLQYEQTMIDAVRGTGGNNATRTLIVQGLGADISNTYTYLSTLPTDNVTDRLMVEIHFYEPYQFALMEDDANWGKRFFYWGEGNHVEGSEHNATWGEESWVLSQFQKMNEKYVQQGIPVIVGEYSAMFRTIMDEGESQEMHDKSVAYYGQVVTQYAKNAGLVPFYWETGAVINRNNGTIKKQAVIDGIMAGAAAGQYPY